jgi:hypothetical protein
MNRIITSLNTSRSAAASLLVFGLASAGAPAGAHSVAYVATRKERGLLIFALVTYAVMQQLRRIVSDKH